MAQKYCYQIGEWVEDNVSQEVEQCVKRKCKWWCACCNKWFCFLVWVIVTVVKWVVQTVCEILGDAFDLIVAIVKGGWDIIAGIFTWDWGRVWDGFLEIVGAAGGLLGDIIRTVVFPCGLYGAFRESVNKWRLIGYVEDLIDKSDRFSDEDRRQIKGAIGINGSGFGLRLTMKSYRGYVRSDYIAPGDTVPALVRWNNDANPATRVDLKILAGFDWTTFGQMGRPDVRGDNGSISEADIEEYLTDPSSNSFSIYALSDSELLDRIHNIQIKGDTIGLKLVVDLEDVQLTQPTQARAIPTSRGVIDNLAAPPFNRPPFDNSPDKSQAASVLCTPVVFGTFLFRQNHFTGYSACLFPSTCLDGGPFGNDGGTGGEYRQRVPNWVSTWAPIHEMGHTFGLCHVDGFNRIMVSTNDHSWWSGWLLWEFLCFSGEPQFIYDEAKKVWDYIVEHFPTDCLANRQIVLT
jgi:hypothetical protein